MIEASCWVEPSSKAERKARAVLSMRALIVVVDLVEEAIVKVFGLYCRIFEFL